MTDCLAVNIKIIGNEIYFIDAGFDVFKYFLTEKPMLHSMWAVFQENYACFSRFKESSVNLAKCDVFKYFLNSLKYFLVNLGN